MYHDFLINVIVVLFFCGVVIGIDLFFNRKYSHYILGVLFGLMTIFVMYDRPMIIEGRFYDFRHITMTLAGFIGGPVTAALAAIISSLYRYNLGGSGSMGGIANIIAFACFGSILGRYLRSSQNGKKVVLWFSIGIVMAFILIFIIAIYAHSAKVLRIVAGPFLIITPLATTLIFNFYYRIYDFFGKASILNTIINHSPINLMMFDTNGPILLSNKMKMQRQFSPYIENPTLLLRSDNIWLNTWKQQAIEIATDDGSHFVAELSSFQMPSGEYACIAIVNDVTDRKREQDALKSAIERFSKAFQLSPHMMTIIRKSDYRYVDVNRRFLEAKGFAREDVIGKTPIEIGVPEREFKQTIETLETQGSVQNYEGTLIMKYGSNGTVILSAEKIQIDNQECVLFAYNDVTEMKRMQTERVEQLTKYLRLEADLSKSNQLIADIINNMPDGFYALDNQWRFTYLNKKAEEIFLKEDLLGTSLWEVIPRARGSLLEVNYQKVMDDGVPITFECLSFIHKDQWYQINAFPSQFGLSVYYKDITERKLAHEKLIEAQEETASILESMTDCFFAIDRNWQFTYVNRPGERAFGKSRDELLGKKITDVLMVNDHDTAYQNFQAVMNEKGSATFEIISETLGNKWVEISAYPTEDGLTCYFRDITSRKMSEQEFARLDRLDLVGQLAAGIAHEIRNPMTTVRGYLQLLGARPGYVAQKCTFELMISELDRANAIITEFLSLAQTKQTQLKSQNLNDILTNLYPLLEADTFIQNKQICFLPGEVPNLELNGKEISQLVLNLTRNGLEAMLERGCLTVKSYVEDGKVVLAIEDEGSGIPPENTHKVGTPFFTTKDNGTGLGLATCYKIAESHNARIQINSSSKGTTFFILFPIPIVGQVKNELIA